MMRQTGGRAVGDTSTRSRPLDCASASASLTGSTPACSPSSPITRTCGTRIRSLTRTSGCLLVEMAATSWPMGRFDLPLRPFARMRKRRAGLREAEPSARRLAVQERTAATAASPEPLSEAARARGGEKRRLLLYGLRAAVYAEPGRGASPARAWPWSPLRHEDEPAVRRDIARPGEADREMHHVIAGRRRVGDARGGGEEALLPRLQIHVADLRQPRPCDLRLQRPPHLDRHGEVVNDPPGQSRGTAHVGRVEAGGEHGR